MELTLDDVSDEYTDSDPTVVIKHHCGSESCSLDLTLDGLGRLDSMKLIVQAFEVLWDEMDDAEAEALDAWFDEE